MDKVTTIIGSDDYLVTNKLHTIISHPKLKSHEVFTYDGEENVLPEIVSEITTISFYDNDKLIIIKNAGALNSTPHVIETFEKIIKKPYDNIRIVLVEKSRDDFKKWLDLVNNFTAIEEIPLITVEQLPTYVLKAINDCGYQISLEALHELIARKNFKLIDIFSELEKLKLYKFDAKAITLTDIEELVNDDIDTVVYHLTNEIAKNNITKALKLFDGLCNKDDDARMILGSIFNFFVNMLNVKRLINEKLYENEIANLMNINPYRVKMLIKDARKFTIGYLQKMISEIAKLDYQSKTSETDLKNAIKLILLRGIEK